MREEIIKAFKNGIFPYIDNKVEKESEEEESKEKKLDENEFLKNIEDESKAFNYELFEKHFNNVVPSALAKKLFETKDKKKNNDLVKLIKSGLHDLKNEIKEMSEEEIEIEKPDKILRIVEKILDFNKKIQLGGALKILTPNQMLSRLPITLAQSKAGNNSEKLKNKTRQLLYSFQISKKLTKQLYKSLIDII